jgi:hypothetical protein
MAWVRTSGLMFLHHCADANIVCSMSRIFSRGNSVRNCPPTLVLPRALPFSLAFDRFLLTSSSTKHYILNEQEHFRQGAPPANLTASISANLDDVTMHEVGATDLYPRFAILTILPAVSVAFRRRCPGWHSFHHVQLQSVSWRPLRYGLSDR